MSDPNFECHWDEDDNLHITMSYKQIVLLAKANGWEENSEEGESIIIDHASKYLIKMIEDYIDEQNDSTES